MTSITSEQVRNAPDATEALRRFFAQVGELPLVDHNGATFDGPLIEATCRRLGVPLPPTFRVLDTLPLARVLLPCLWAHWVEVLAQHFGCHRAGAHQADVDVQMLGDILAGLQGVIDEGPTGWAVYELLHRAGDPWADLLTAPTGAFTAGEVTACFGARLVPLLPVRAAFTGTTDLLPGSPSARNVSIIAST